MENQRRLGDSYEQKAAAYLEEQGYEILERNFSCRLGEIDIIARKKGVLIFCEIKYRRDDACGNPLEAVDGRKQRRISRVAMYYYTTHGYGEDSPCRFDVIGISGTGKLQHIENAFNFQW